MAKIFDIGKALTCVALIATILAGLSIPTAKHVHKFGSSTHSHSVNLETAVSNSNDGRQETSDSTDQSDFSKTNRSKFEPRFVGRTEFQDVDIDDIRNELLFGESEEVDSKASQVVAASDHDESIPHMHVMLLGLEFTIALPHEKDVAVVDVEPIGHSNGLRIVTVDPVESGCSFFVPTDHIGSCKSNNPVVKFHQVIVSKLNLPFQDSTPEIFVNLEDSHLTSAEIILDPPPPRLA